jgi:hypothetical protein
MRYAVNFAVKGGLSRPTKRMKPGGKGVDEVIDEVRQLSNRNHRAGLTGHFQRVFRFPGGSLCASRLHVPFFVVAFCRPVSPFDASHCRQFCRQTLSFLGPFHWPDRLMQQQQ